MRAESWLSSKLVSVTHARQQLCLSSVLTWLVAQRARLVTKWPASMDPKGAASSSGRSAAGQRGRGEGGQNGQAARPQEVVQQVFQVDMYTAAFMLVLLVLALFKVWRASQCSAYGT